MLCIFKSILVGDTRHLKGHDKFYFIPKAYVFYFILIFESNLEMLENTDFCVVHER